MDANSLVRVLCDLEVSEAATVLTEVLKQRPELAPAVVNVSVPDLTYAPVKAITERRCIGTIKMADAMGKGYGFISCPELYAVFGHDVFVHRKQLVHCYPGQEVNFAVLLNRENKPQAFDIVEGRNKDGPGDAFGKGGGWMNSGWGGVSDGMGGMFGGMCGPMGCAGSGGMGGMMGGMGHGMGMLGSMRGMGGKGDGKGDGKGKQRMTALGTCIGVVKSFNHEKGYGFVTSQDIAGYGVDGDAYLHVSQKGDCEVGAEVGFTLYLLSGRPQARELRSPEDARKEVQTEAEGKADREPMNQLQGGSKGDFREQLLGSWTGTIKSYNHEKKFGFLTCLQLNGQSGIQGDVFVHDKDMKGFAVGNTVSFTAYVKQDGRLHGRDLKHAAEQAAKRMRTA